MIIEQVMNPIKVEIHITFLELLIRKHFKV